MARRRSRVRGSKSFRRILKNMPEAMRTEIADLLQKSRSPAEALVRARVGATTRSRSGRLLAGVRSRVYPRSLRLRVGFLTMRAGRAKLFYARILDLGRKAQTVNVTRGRSKPYLMKVRAMPARRFVTGGMGDLKQVIGTRLRGVWDRALCRLAGGSDE